MFKKKIKNAVLIIHFFAFISCSSIYEVHYFKDKIGTRSGERAKLIPNYYKVEISGYSFLSSSRYVSGYFDQNAINLYFNEFSQPENGKLFGSESSESIESTTDSGKKANGENLLTTENGNELVLVFSTNAKAVTDQIGNISKNQSILNSMASITQKDKIEEGAKMKLQLNDLDIDIKNFIFNSEVYLNGISSKTEAEKKLLINQLAQTIN